MAAPSIDDSNTHHASCKIPVKEQSLSSQESTNCSVYLKNGYGDPYVASNGSKNGKSKLHSHAPSSIPREPAINLVRDEIVPLSRNPYFTCILQKTQVQSPFQLMMPRHFWPFLPSASVPMVLSCRNKSWEIIYYGDRITRRFNPGWRKFVIDNNLKIGDGCVFELMDGQTLEFRVQILSGQIPPGIAKVGQNITTPVVLD